MRPEQAAVPAWSLQQRVLRLAELVAALMAGQSVLGLLLAAEYRDVEWIRTTWYGNDWVTLVVAVPLIMIGCSADGVGLRRRLLLLGIGAYAAYNYAFYLLGAALNAFFPLYVVLFIAAVSLLISGFVAARPADRVARVGPRAARALAAYFACVAIGLTMVWLGIWAAHVFFGQPTPVETETFRLVAALDLSVMVPALILGAVLLWRRARWGVIITATAGVQASLYLLVLTVNSLLAVQRGLADWPGELPLWAPLFAATAAATAMVFHGIQAGDGRTAHEDGSVPPITNRQSPITNL